MPLRSRSSVAIVAVAITVGSMLMSLAIAETVRVTTGGPANLRHYLLTLGIPSICAPVFSIPYIWGIQRLNAAREELERLVRTDVLTGLLNRRGFFERAPDCLTAAEQGGQPVAALMVDIDRFKSVNDRYGHAAGDRVIEMVACQIRDIVARVEVPDGICARVGGEEFIILLRGVQTEAVEGLAQRLCSQVRETELPIGDVLVRATVSIGVAMRRQGQTIDTLLRAADIAVYKAKSGGRDRYVHERDPRRQLRNVVRAA